MGFNNYSRVILKTDVMILPSRAKLILVVLLAILHKVLRPAVAVIDKTDCIMKEDINMLILFQHLDRISWVDSMGRLSLFSLEKFKTDPVLHFIISIFNHILCLVFTLREEGDFRGFLVSWVTDYIY